MEILRDPRASPRLRRRQHLRRVRGGSGEVPTRLPATRSLLRARLGLCGLVLLLAAGCEKVAQVRRCAEANGDVAACRALADDCITIINSTCSGACEAGCMPDELAGRCRLAPGTRCPADERIFSNGRPGSLSNYPFKAQALSEAALALANRPIFREDFERLTEQDKRELCGSVPGHACTLVFDEALGRADCRLPRDPCARCELKVRDAQCIATNKCSGIICL